MKTLRSLIFGFGVLVAASSAHAYVTTSGGVSFRTGVPTPTLMITAPITLSITTSGFAADLILRGWVVGDGTQSQVRPNPSGQMLFFTLGTYAGGVPLNYLIDNLDSATPAVAANDGVLSFGLFVNAGDTLTIPAQSFTFNSDAGFNLTTPTVFTGDVFLLSNNGLALTAPTSVGNVPEPAAWALLSAGAMGAGIAALRRRRPTRRVRGSTSSGSILPAGA